MSFYLALRRHYPDFEQLLGTVPDHRKRHTYEVAEILSGGLLMFLLRRGSRNQADQLAGKRLEGNYLSIFGMRLPIMDTVHCFLGQLPCGELEKLKELMLRRLMERKVFGKWKFQGLYNLSFDATGIQSFDQEPYEDCPYKETKYDIKWYAGVLEAKLVMANGFSISVDSEWIINQNGKFDKQDCEQAAFKRLSAKVKSTYPRMDILVTADGLYCSGPVFSIIKEYGWDFIFTFKDDSLKSLWKEIKAQTPTTIERVVKKLGNGQWLTESFAYLNELCYQGHRVSFLEHRQYQQDLEATERHVHLTSLEIGPHNARQASEQGRMRWKIENQGFNAQKNHGFALGHKYARKNFNAMKNYYQLMQIAHMLSQLAEKLQGFVQLLKQKGRTLMALVEDATATLKKETLSLKEVLQHYHKHKQLRY